MSQLDEQLSKLGQLRQELTALQAEQKKLDKTTEEGAKAFEKNRLKIQELNKEVKALGKEVSNDTAWKKFKSGVTSALGSVGKQFQALSKTFLTNPIGLVVTAITVAVTKLMDAFKRSDDATTALKKLGAAFQPFVDLVNKGLDKAVGWLTEFANYLSDKIPSLLTNAISGITEKLSSIANTLANFAEKLGMDGLATKLRNASKSAKEFGDNATQAFKKSSKEAKGLITALDKLEDKQRRNLVNEAERNKEIAKLRADLAATDEKDYATRVSILEKIIALEKKNQTERVTIAQENLRILRKTADQNHDTTDETKNAIAQAEKDVIDAQASLAENTRKFVKELTSLQNKINEDMLIGEEIIKKYSDDNDELAGSYIALVEQISKFGYTSESLNDTLTNLNKDYKDGKIRLEEYTKAVGMLLELQRQLDEEEGDDTKTPAQIMKEREDNVKSAINSAIQYAEAASQIIRELYAFTSEQQKKQIKAGLKATEEALDSERQALDAKLQAGLISEMQYNAEVEKLNKERQNAQAQAEYETQLLDWKNALLQAAIQTALGIAKAVAQNPMGGGLPGSAIAAALGAVQLGIIGAKKPVAPKFGNGGMIYGPSHKAGGVMLEAEGGEAIINKRSTKKYAGLLSAINQAGGGVAIPSRGNGIFAKGGIVNDGGYGLNGVGAKTKMPPIYVTVEDIRKGEKLYSEVLSNRNL